LALKPRERKDIQLLCIADHVDPLIYAASLKERFGNVQAVLSCGDLKAYYYEFIVSTLNVPFFYVLGNHSPFTLHPGLNVRTTPPQYQQGGDRIPAAQFQGGILVDGRCVRYRQGDIIIAGLGGSRRYNKGDNQYTESQMFFRILRLVPRMLLNRIFRGRYLDIFVTHAPPRWIHDKEDLCHQGFRIFRWFLRVFRPVYMIHGHIHLYDRNEVRKTLYHETCVINAYDHYRLFYKGEKEINER